ncbi:MAG: hypothetical protein IH845_04220 [Nanoarchaeota archaeon]|nr:hypothetical protein [Nanoarchaeota archaeon]
MENSLEKLTVEREKEILAYKGLGIDYGLVVGTESGQILTTNGKNYIEILESTWGYDESTGKLYRQDWGNDGESVNVGYIDRTSGEFRVFYDKESKEFSFFDHYRGLCNLTTGSIDDALKGKRLPVVEAEILSFYEDSSSEYKFDAMLRVLEETGSKSYIPKSNKQNGLSVLGYNRSNTLDSSGSILERPFSEGIDSHIVTMAAAPLKEIGRLNGSVKEINF